jgi:hypothetical protein
VLQQLAVCAVAQHWGFSTCRWVYLVDTWDMAGGTGAACLTSPGLVCQHSVGLSHPACSLCCRECMTSKSTLHLSVMLLGFMVDTGSRL